LSLEGRGRGFEGEGIEGFGEDGQEGD